jgi:hypothetical protein
MGRYRLIQGGMILRNDRQDQPQRGQLLRLSGAKNFAVHFMQTKYHFRISIVRSLSWEIGIVRVPLLLQNVLQKELILDWRPAVWLRFNPWPGWK